RGFESFSLQRRVTCEPDATTREEAARRSSAPLKPGARRASGTSSGVVLEAARASLGHEAVGLDGSQQFVAMARSHSQCEVLHQDFLAMQLRASRFDGVFANASLFHVPSQELPRVLLELCKTLKPRGVLFSSNPRGNNEE